jgi:hypothetical protein
MAVCYATAVGPKKGKSTWGVEILQYNPILVDGRPLLLRRAKERTIRTRPSTASPRNFFFFLSFLTGDPDISLWPSTEGPSREGSSKYHRWLCGDISAVLPLMAEPQVNGGSNTLLDSALPSMAID